MLERGPGGEEYRPPPPRPLSFPHPRQCVPTDGDWQLQAPPGAPGTARQGPTRSIMLVNDGGIATQPKAPGQDRPRAASSDAARPDRLRAALLAPGHERPFTTSTGAAKHGRPRAATRAPGADVPPATTAEAPGQHRLRAALLAPGHERPFTTSTGAAKHGRPRAAPRAPGQHRLRAMANATVALPAGQPQLRQESLPHTPANPRILTYSYSHHTISSLRRKPQSSPRPAARRYADSPSLPGKGPGVRSRPLTTHQAHPAIQVPPHPRPCSTARTGFPRNHPSRAPPQLDSPSPHGGEGARG